MGGHSPEYLCWPFEVLDQRLVVSACLPMLAPSKVTFQLQYGMVLSRAMWSCRVSALGCMQLQSAGLMRSEVSLRRAPSMAMMADKKGISFFHLVHTLKVLLEGLRVS